jgi:hypothetical protein
MRRIHLLLITLIAVGLLAGSASAQGTPATIYLPLVNKTAATVTFPSSIFGLHIGEYATNAALDLGRAAAPGLSRVGDALWDQVEPVQGGGYHWDALAILDQRIAAARARGIEPAVVIQGAPAWARTYPENTCSPVRPDAFNAYDAFVRALVTRYQAGPSAVRYWEIWNEPDFYRGAVSAGQGYGCWAEPGLPYSGGDRFGALLKVAYPAVKEANPVAIVISGSLTHIFAGAQYNDFLDGMLASGAGTSFDLFGFHAYSDWTTEDLLVRKVAFARERFANYGLPNKPFILTETAALCLNDARCGEVLSAAAKQEQQAHQTARVNAEALALRLTGVMWFTLADQPPGFGQSQLLSMTGGQLLINPSYYALRNSASLLKGAQATDSQPLDLAPNQSNIIQALRFTRPGTTLFVLWKAQPGKASTYQLAVAPGAQATCYERLDLSVPQVSDCSDTNGDGKIVRAVSEATQYIEVR